MPCSGKAIVNGVTLVGWLAGYIGSVQIRAAEMTNRFDFVTLVTAICVAGYVAIMLEYVANAGLGYSGAQIRNTAVVAAIVMAMLMAINFLGKRLGKPGRPR
jgi:membrane-bound acyltransferase YfiQ involved in biofilm formation